MSGLDSASMQMFCDAIEALFQYLVFAVIVATLLASGTVAGLWLLARAIRWSVRGLIRSFVLGKV